MKSRKLLAMLMAACDRRVPRVLQLLRRGQRTVRVVQFHLYFGKLDHFRFDSCFHQNRLRRSGGYH